MPEGKTIFSDGDVRQRVDELAEQISADYRDLNPILVTILRGAVYFMVDLTRLLSIEHRLDFLGISSYGPETRSGVVKITKDLDFDINDQHVLIIEDIIDTGLTLHYLLRILRERGPASVKVCSFLDRSAQRIAELNIDYRGFEVLDEFVVGYGLDQRERYRNLPRIVAQKK